MSEQLTICLTNCWSRFLIACTTTPANAGSSLGLPARKRALSALTTSTAPSEGLELQHWVEAIKRSHIRSFLCVASRPTCVRFACSSG
eukprot:scaffold126132_cov69-Phaeocystis_antarctica.AAC.4